MSAPSGYHQHDRRTGAGLASLRDHRHGPWLLVAVGLLGAVASVLWLPVLWLYLGCVALAAVGAVWSAGRVTGRTRTAALIGTALVVLAAVLVPWRLAEAERTGSPRWSLATDGLAWGVLADGDRVLFTDEDGLHAVDLADGERLWSMTEVGRVDSFSVATSGHVVASGGSGNRHETFWISPSGEVLWRHEETKELVFAAPRDQPVAAAEGVLVVRRCTSPAEGTDAVCGLVGVGAAGPDAAPLFEVVDHGTVKTSRQQEEADSQYDAPARLPEVSVVDLPPGKGGAAAVIDAADGSVVEEISVGATVVVTGDTVVHDSGPGGEQGQCRTHGTSRDGTIDWTADAPCLNGSAVVLGERIYGVIEKVPGRNGGRDHPVNESFVIDATTGESSMVGALSLFNLDSDRVAGVPGSEVVVQRRDQQLTGIDPGSGATLWEMETPGDSIPGVTAAHGATVVLSRPTRGHNPFLGARDGRGTRTVVLDSASGEVTGRMTVEHVTWNTVPVGKGQALVVDRDVVFLIGSEPEEAS